MSVFCRWKGVTSDVAAVPRFEYHDFDEEEVNIRKARSSHERYWDAVSACHLIDSELADIDDEHEYQEFLDFVLAQWRNARQRKRIRVASDQKPGVGVSTPVRNVHSSREIIADIQPILGRVRRHRGSKTCRDSFSSWSYADISVPRRGYISWRTTPSTGSV